MRHRADPGPGRLTGQSRLGRKQHPPDRAKLSGDRDPRGVHDWHHAGADLRTGQDRYRLPLPHYDL